jgi:hypothetical protein
MILTACEKGGLEILLAGHVSRAGSITFRKLGGVRVDARARDWPGSARGGVLSSWARRCLVVSWLWPALGPGSGKGNLARSDFAARCDEGFCPAGVRGGGGGRSTAAGSNQFQGLWLLPLSLATGLGSNFEPVTRIGVTQPPGECVHSRTGL